MGWNALEQQAVRRQNPREGNNVRSIVVLYASVDVLLSQSGYVIV